MDSSGTQAKGLTSFGIKIIAICTMFIDHVGVVVIQPYLNARVDNLSYDLSQFLNKAYNITRSVGRMAFPLFCFMLVEGFFHTRSRWKYLLRLAIFALISEIPFNLALKRTTFTWEKQSVMVTLTLGFLMLIILEALRQKEELSDVLKSFLTLVVIAAFAIIAYYCKCDYEYKGVLMIAGIYLLYPLFNINRFTFSACTGIMFFWEWSKTVTHFPASLSPILLCFYNGQKGRSLKYFFYLFYPLHLLLLYAVYRYVMAFC